MISMKSLLEMLKKCSFFSSRAEKGEARKNTKKQWLTSVKCSTLWRKHVPTACPLSFKLHHFPTVPRTLNKNTPQNIPASLPLKTDSWNTNSNFSLVKFNFQGQFCRSFSRSPLMSRDLPRVTRRGGSLFSTFVAD